MHEKIRWSLPPFKKNAVIVTAGINAFFEINGLPHRDSLRMQVCYEGVFAYCVANIWKAMGLETITTSLALEDDCVILTLRHLGPRGEWDDDLHKYAEKLIRRTSFENMGLYIANEMLADLTYETQFDMADGKRYRKYVLTYRFDQDS